MKWKEIYSPLRIYRIFMVILTVFMLMRRKEKLLYFLRPVKPQRLREYINILGASFIKLAQVLATRADFFPTEYIKELKQLHDEIPPMNHSAFQKVFNRAFDKRVCFQEFEETPIASASIGQVHKAIMKDGTEVAVKIRRYNIEKVIRADIKILGLINRILRPLFSEYTKNSIEAVISEFSWMILKEVDLSIELANLQKFTHIYTNSGVRFPKAYPECSSVDALIMSYEHGIRFDNKEKMKELKISFEDIMGRLIRFYTEQMLVQGFFHADPHPGNLLVSEDGDLVLLDFGMVKRVGDDTRRAIIELVKSANERDFELYIKACKKLGIIAGEAQEEELQDMAERMFDIFENNTLDAMTMQTLAFEVLNSFKDIPFKLPQEAIYIMRASSIIEGLGTSYIDNFNGIKDILPILKDNIPKALGADKGFADLVIDEIYELPLTLTKAKKIINDLSDFSLEVRISKYSLESIKENLKKYFKPVIGGFVFIVTAFFVRTFEFQYVDAVSIGLFAVGVFRIIFYL